MTATSSTHIEWPKEQPPLLVVVIDTEAEFDWAGESRRACGVRSARHQVKAQRIFERFGLRPTYAVDYPVGSQPDGYQPIRDIWKSGGCEIGAHLQPWDTPPLTEPTTDRNSYPGNLPEDLERAKLHRLTQVIEANLGLRPRIYKAGRYGWGKRTADILLDLGYEVDVSHLPGTNLSFQLGPDFSATSAHPHWLEEERLLEIPLTIGYAGLLAAYGPALRRRWHGLWMEKLHVPGVLAALGLLNRITLTPEGVPLKELCRLVRVMVRGGFKVFSFAYHSPSLLPGNTPYVRDEAELQRFLGSIEGFLDFFMAEIGGRPATPIEVRQAALALGHGAVTQSRRSA